MNAEPCEPSRRRGAGRWRVAGLRMLVALAVLWTLHFPLRMERLFRAIPDRAELTSYHRGLAREWRHLTLREDLAALLRTLGGEAAVEWREEEGIFQTLYWLTGRHTVFGLRAPRPGEGLEGIQLSGASYVGWKARPMELLWHLRWIPGLGKLEVTPLGTRYYVFRHSKTMRNLGLVLSLDLFEGVLVGVLSNRPDDVRELHSRVEYDADLAEAFCGDARPWEHLGEAPHRVWLPRATTGRLDGRIGAWTFALPSFGATNLEIRAQGDPDVLRGRLAAGRRFQDAVFPGGPRVAAEAPFAAALVPLAWFKEGAAEALLPQGAEQGLAALLACGKPHGGRLLGMALPALQARMPWPRHADPRDWAHALADRLSQWGGIGPILPRDHRTASGRSVQLLSFAKADLLSGAAPEDCVFLEAAGGALVLGSHLGSHLRQAEGEEGAPYRGLEQAFQDHASASAWAWVDLPRTFEELRHAVAIYRMAARFAASEAVRESDAALGLALRGLDAAAALGRLQCVLTPRERSVELLLRQERAAD